MLALLLLQVLFGRQLERIQTLDRLSELPWRAQFELRPMAAPLAGWAST